MTGRPALVAGASSGIGREVAVELSKAGCPLLLVARREEALQATADRCPGPAEALAGDLRSERFYSAISSAISDLQGEGLPIVVHAAGLAYFGPTRDADPARIQEEIDVNLTSAILLARTCIPWLSDRGGGDLAFIGSIASTRAFPGAAAYVAAKHGLLGLARSLRAELGGEGIRVTAILPGSTNTPLWDAQAFVPSREDMLSPTAVAEAVRDAVLAPRDRCFDEISIMPPKGIL